MFDVCHRVEMEVICYSTITKYSPQLAGPKARPEDAPTRAPSPTKAKSPQRTRLGPGRTGADRVSLECRVIQGDAARPTEPGSVRLRFI